MKKLGKLVGALCVTLTVTVGLLFASNAAAMTEFVFDDIVVEHSRADLKEDVLAEFIRTMRNTMAREAVYPHWSRRQGTEGTVVIQLTLDNGYGAISTESSSGSVDLDSAARRAVKRARQRVSVPAELQEGTFVMKFPIMFQLQG